MLFCQISPLFIILLRLGATVCSVIHITTCLVILTSSLHYHLSYTIRTLGLHFFITMPGGKAIRCRDSINHRSLSLDFAFLLLPAQMVTCCVELCSLRHFVFVRLCVLFFSEVTSSQWRSLGRSGVQGGTSVSGRQHPGGGIFFTFQFFPIAF